MKLYNIHCGFYDDRLSNGIFEFHVNIPVIADSLETAKSKVRTNLDFINMKMHIDGIQEIDQVDGFKLQPIQSVPPTASNQIKNHLYRDL